jgi:hypothetical protein
MGNGVCAGGGILVEFLGGLCYNGGRLRRVRAYGVAGVGTDVMADDDGKPRKRRRNRALTIVIIVAVGIVVGLVLLRVGARHRLERRMDEIRAAGYPATPAELNDWYAIPGEGENSADIIIDASAYLYKAQEPNTGLVPIVGRAKLPLRTEAFSEQARSLIREHLAANEKALGLLHAVVGMEYGRYPINLGAGFAVLLPHLEDVRESARVLALDGVLAAEEGNGRLCVESIRAIVGAGRSLAKEPMILSQFFRLSCNSLAVSCLERAINRVEFTDEQLAALGACLAGARDDEGMARAFAGDRCCSIGVFKDPKLALAVSGGRSAPGAVFYRAYTVAGLGDVGATMYIDFSDAYIEATKLAPHERQEACAAIDKRMKETPRIHVLVEAISPSFSRIVTVDVSDMAKLRTACTAIAVERYRLATGRLPESPGELVPAYLDSVGKDPFDGKDLRYKRLEAGFVVYSVGEDGQDDGGTERRGAKKGRAKQWDITFIVDR